MHRSKLKILLTAAAARPSRCRPNAVRVRPGLLLGMIPMTESARRVGIYGAGCAAQEFADFDL